MLKNTVQQVLQKHTSVNCLAQNFLAFMLHLNTKNTQHGTQIGFGVTNIDVENIVRDADDQKLM